VDIDKLVTYEDEAIVEQASGQGYPISIIPVPKSLQPRFFIHGGPQGRLPVVDEIFEKNKVGYYSLYDALKGGYDGCKYWPARVPHTLVNKIIHGIWGQ